MIPGQLSHRLVERSKEWLLVRARPATASLFIAALLYASSVLLVHWEDHCEDHGEACALCVAAASVWATLPATCSQVPEPAFWEPSVLRTDPVRSRSPEHCYAPRGPPRAPILGRLV